jgi:hypothetical protein
MLPTDTKTEFDIPKKFKVILQIFLREKTFYSLDEYFELQKDKHSHMIRLGI